MFSKELENLIQATLEDGVLEEYEKTALVKRAKAEGVDLTELEIYINSLLQKRKRESEEKKEAKYSEAEKKKKEEFGKVCPACGKQVSSLSLVCDCGYEFKKDQRESAVQLLSDKISKIQSQKVDSDEEKKQRDGEIINSITMFPVPNTKEDVMEFLALAVPNSRQKGGLWGTTTGRIKLLAILAVIVFILSLIFGPSPSTGAEIGAMLVVGIAFYGGMVCFGDYSEDIAYNKKADAWRAKFDQVLMKGRSLKGDSEFTQMLDYYENQMKKNEADSKKIFGIKLFG